MTLREDLEAIWRRPGVAQPLHYARFSEKLDYTGLPKVFKGRPAACAPPKSAVVWPDPPMQPLASSLPRRRSKRGKQT